MLLSSNEVQNNDTNETWPEIEGNCCAILDESKRKVRVTPTQHTKKTRHKVMWSWSTQTNRGTYLKLGVIIHQNRNNSYIRHESAKEHVIFSGGWSNHEMFVLLCWSVYPLARPTTSVCWSHTCPGAYKPRSSTELLSPFVKNFTVPFSLQC